MSYYPARILKLIADIEMHCPCGARPETIRTHPHVSGCQVEELKLILDSWFAQSKAAARPASGEEGSK